MIGLINAETALVSAVRMFQKLQENMNTIGKEGEI